MATLVLSCSSAPNASSSFLSNAAVQVTYSVATDGTLTITDVAGKKGYGDSASSWYADTNTVEVTVNGTMKSFVPADNKVLFPTSSYASWGAPSGTWTGLNGTYTISVITRTPSNTTWNGYNANFSGSITVQKSTATLSLGKGTGVSAFTGGGVYDYGATATTTASAATGYLLSHYYGTTADGSGTNTWTTCSGLGSHSMTWTMNANRSINVYATPITYTVTYSGNGNTGGSTSSNTHTYNASNSLQTNGFVRRYTITLNSQGGSSATAGPVDYLFDGWTGSNGSTYVNGQQNVGNLSSTNGATVTMTAKWRAQSIVLPVVSRAGYRFDGWATTSTATNGQYQGGSDFTPTSNTTLYAVWKEIDTSNDVIVYVKVNGAWKSAQK